MVSALLALSVAATPPHLVSAETFRAIATELSGELARETTSRIVDHHRIQGSPMMTRSAELVLSELKAAGIEAQLENFRSDGATRYGTFTSPLAWEIKSGELWVTHAGAPGDDFQPFRLSRYADVPMSVTTYSKGGEWTGELIDVGAGTEEKHYANQDVAGKVVLAFGYAAVVQREAVIKRRALGVVIYPRPGDRADHPDLIRYNGMWPRAEELPKASGGFQISTNQYTTLRDLMAKGTVKVRGAIDAKLAPGKMTLVHAFLRGSTKPEQEVVLIAHLDHPKWSANDNASGSAALVEIARTLAVLARRGAIAKPASTIHFVWVPEYFGTAAWLSAHPEIRRCGAWDDPRAKPKKPVAENACVVAALNLDMAGENTVLTNSQFYFTRAPDSVPSFLEALLSDVLEQTRAAELFAPTGSRHLWATQILPYAQGSDHDLLLGVGIPATMLGHWPDWTHHSSDDRVDKVDASELLRVGVLSAVTAQWIATANKADWERLEQLRRADQIATLASRIRGSTLARSKRLSARIAVLATQLEAAAADAPARAEKRGSGPRRLVLLPYEDALNDLNADERKFWDDATKRFGAKDVGIHLAVFETVSAMDGRTSSAELAQHLVDQFDVEVDAAWIDRLLQILSARKLISIPQ